jgi:probable rRNA maturation factor
VTSSAPAIVNRQRRVALSTARLARSAGCALAAVGRAESEVEILVVDDAEIAELNARFLGAEGPTDVLAFPLELSTSDPGLLGQVVISAQTAQRQARRAGVTLAMEMDLLATHGILHLVGYDDRDPVEARVMHRRAREILDAGARMPARPWKGLLP